MKIKWVSLEKKKTTRKISNQHTAASEETMEGKKKETGKRDIKN